MTKRMTILTRNQREVLTGLDVLLRDGNPALEGKRLGLVTNHTGVTRDLRSIVDVLHRDERYRLTKLFAPEHGVRGAVQAGDKVLDEVDTTTGLPVVSLYGTNRMASAEQLSGLDAVVFDILDAGARHYTYIST